MRHLLLFIAVLAVVASACTPTGEVGGTTTTTRSPAAPSSTSSTGVPGDGTTSSTTALGYTPVFEESRCEFEEPAGRDITCGFVVVPENRAAPGGNDVRLAVAIVAAERGPVAEDPIIYLDGGPGGESLEPLQFTFDSVFAPFAATRDLIFFDQRGIGLSEPSLECREDLDLTYELLDADIPNSQLLQLQSDAIQDCRNRLARDGVDLSQYTSATNAADVNDIRIALGHDQLNLFGISYGTRLAQTVMRDHPEGVRSVILDSVYTPDVDLIATTPENLDRALNKLFAGCAADTECNELYPDLENRLFDLVERLETSPIIIEATDILQGDRYDVIVDGSGLLGSVFQGLYSEQIIPILPQMIVDVENGDTITLSQLASINITNLPFVSFGMHLSVQCAEEVPFADPVTVAAADDPFPEFVDLFEISSNVGPGVFDLCDIWDVEPSGAVEALPVVSDIPTLVLSGEYDPITPPAWGELAAASLSNSTYVLALGLGHGVSLGSPCTTDLALAFIDDPTGELDTSCIDDLRPPAWVGTEAAVVAFELVPVEIDVFGVTVSTLRPDSWEEIQPGVYIRGAGGVNQTALIVQAFPAALGEQLIVDFFAESISPDSPVAAQPDFGPWSRWLTNFDGFALDLAVLTSGTNRVLVVLVTDEDERSQLLDTLLEPVLDATTIG